jgi:hypothetical protein
MRISDEAMQQCPLGPLTWCRWIPAGQARLLTMGNYYDTLGVWRDVAPNEIDQRYRFMVDRLSDEPDSEDTEVRRRQMDEAHAVLMDPQRRAAYDESLTRTPSGTSDTGVEEEKRPSGPTTLLDELPDKTRQHLEPQLHDGEEAIAVIKGASSQAIIAFPTRLFVVKPGFMAGSTFGARVTSFDYRNITAIEVNKKLVTAVIEVIAAGYQGTASTNFWSSKDGVDPYRISNCLPLGRDDLNKAESKLALIRRQISQVQNPVSAAVSTTPSPASATAGIADQLAKLSELREQGVLSGDEFELAKKRVLTL